MNVREINANSTICPAVTATKRRTVKEMGFVNIPINSTSKMIGLSGRGTPGVDTRLNMQLCLKAGETIETGSGKKLVLGTERVELPPADLGGRIVHRVVSIGAEMADIFAGVGIDDQDAAIAVAVGDIEAIGLGIDHHVRRLVQ